ncbi:MAG: ABC transporter permease [Clostridiales bacterium]|jgi:sodium transport system permease protein|nr:ABC transporter permease [Clostridiales bacterium]MDR2713583.1 ABC transporter permease [Clostridiales bacterium]
MKSNILMIMKKEFARFFGDRRMLIMLLLPGILIYVVYSFMGTALQSMYAPDQEYFPVIYVADLPDSLNGQVMDNWEWAQLQQIAAAETPAAKEKVTLKEADLCLIFPSGFDSQVETYNVLTAPGPAPNIEIYYNSTEVNSQQAYGRITALLEAYESSLANKFDINRDITAPDLATEEDAAASFISTLLPMLLLMFLFSGCMAIAPESIAGEKERGTIGALLVSPLKRSQLAIGKILSLAVLAFLAGLVSAVATILALPKLMGGSEGINVNIYGATDYFFLALVILSTIILIIALISIISAFSKTVKEATTAVTPFMIVVMLVGVTAMFGSGAQTEQIYYLIPLYNSVQSMSGVFSLDYSALNLVLTALSNLIYACAGGFILTKMFNSEKVMFLR